MREIPFLRLLSNLASKIIEKYSEGDKQAFLEKSPKPVPYTPKEAYIVDTLLSLGEVETVYEQLEQSAYFLSNFRQTDSLKKKGINRFNHLIYHIESHLFRLTGILDRILIHVNTVLNLGLRPEECKSYNMLVNKKGKAGKYHEEIKARGSDLMDELINMLNSVNTYRDLRNIISHQGRYQGENLKYVEMYYILLESEGPNEYKDGQYKYHFKRKTDQAMSKTKDEMLNFNNKIRQLLDKIYPKLEEVWKEEYEKFKTDA